MLKTKNVSLIILATFCGQRSRNLPKKKFLQNAWLNFHFISKIINRIIKVADIMAKAASSTFSWLMLFVILLIFLQSCAKSLDYLDYTDCWDDLDCEEGDCCYGDILGLPGFCASCGITLRNFDGNKSSHFNTLW